MNQIIFDVSSLRTYMKHVRQPSGIQRVAIMVIAEAIKLHGAHSVFLGYFDISTKGYLLVSAQNLDPDDPLEFFNLARALNVHGNFSDILPSLEKYARRPVRRWVHTMVHDFNAWQGRNKHFTKRGLTLEKWKALRKRKPAGGKPAKPQPFFDIAKPGARLILLDANWDVIAVEKFFRSVHEKGYHISTLVHDLIPAVTPQYCASLHSFKFLQWLIDCARYTDIFLANSDATAADLQTFLNKYGVDTPVVSVPLAQAGLPTRSDIDEDNANFLGVDLDRHPELRRVIGIDPRVATILKTPYALCVGTVEVRKNVWRIAQAWKRLLDRDTPDMPKLVFAGRRGWFVDDFFRFMDSTGWLYGWVEFFDGPTDAELAFLYRNCEFTITASLYEGWGLPIGESLSYGKTAVVSNTSSMPEVGGDMVEYCDPDSIASIASACANLIADPAHRRSLEDRISGTRLRDWQDVAVDMLNAAGVETPRGPAGSGTRGQYSAARSPYMPHSVQAPS